MRAVPLLAPVVALCACADMSTVHTSYYNSGYSPGHVQLAAASGPSLAVIRNNPFPGDHNNEGVLAAMQARNIGPKMYFAQTPRPDDRYGYKVVMNFGPSIYGTNYGCTYEPTPPTRMPPGGPITVSAAFCVGDILLTDAVGSTGAAAGPDDPRFQRLIGDIIVALTPPYDPNRRGDDCRGPGC